MKRLRRALGTIVLMGAMALGAQGRDRATDNSTPAHTPSTRTEVMQTSTLETSTAEQGVISAPDTATRVRPTRRNTWADYTVPNAIDVVITNHDTNEQDVRAYYPTTTQVYHMTPGQTITLPNTSYTGPLMFMGNDLEIRAKGPDAITKAAMDTSSVIPVSNTNPTVRLVDYAGGPKNLELRNSAGAKLAETTVNLQNFTTYTTTLDDLFPNSPRENLMQVILSRGAGDADGNPSKPLNSATGLEYVLDFEPGSMLTLANPAATSMNIPTTTFYQENVTHTPNTQPIATVSINNAGIAEIDPLISTRTTAKGAVSIQGSPVSTPQGLAYQPFIAWGAAFSENDMAVARQGTNNDARQIYDLSINDLAGNETITVMNTSSDFAGINAHVTGYKNGVQTSTYALPLGAKMNQTLPLSTIANGADRIILSLDNAPTGNALTPQAAIIATKPDGETAKGYKVARAGTKVTGEEYVAKWLDSLKTQYFFADNKMSKCLWQNNCGTPNYATSLAQLLAQSPTSPYSDSTQLLQAFKDVTDGNVANDELYSGFSPMNFDMRNNGNVRIYLAPAGTSLVDWNLTPTSKINVYNTFRNFARDYFDANPTACGGTSTSGCNLNYDPGFTNQLKPQ